jgi:hypothetical protein
VQLIHTVLRKAPQQAVSDEILPRNVCQAFSEIPSNIRHKHRATSPLMIQEKKHTASLPCRELAGAQGLVYQNCISICLLSTSRQSSVTLPSAKRAKTITDHVVCWPVGR